ncbi:MAG TPA: phosphopantetheine-binding protein [Desulfurivibrionaceae bacterium]|nr:phosphopantetheine-binding protein [Desulfurivibrionaceae bacterium]
MEELKKQIKEIIVRDLKLQGITTEEIMDDAPLFEEGLGLDSLDAVELVVLVQKHFGVQIEDMDEGQAAFKSVNTLAEFITKRRPN